MDHTCDDNVHNVLNIKDEAYFTSTHYINGTNDIYMNDDENYVHTYYAKIILSNNHEDASSGS